MLLPLYIGNVICSAGQTTFGKLYTKRNGSSLVFNLNKTLIGYSIIFLDFLYKQRYYILI